MRAGIRTLKSEMDAVAALCPACGMCCDGVLFADVELQRRDDPARLRLLGMKLFARRGKQCFRQPCAGFDGKLCRIYADRPERCRGFNCRLVERLQAGEVTVTKALKSIATARNAADTVLRLVRLLGDEDEAAPLGHRYSRIMAQPIDLAGDEANIQRRGELMRAVGKLAMILERDFLV